MKIDLKKGDTILTGKWQNHKVEVRRFGKNDIGQPTVNGKPMLKFRIEKLMKKKKKKVLEHLQCWDQFVRLSVMLLFVLSSCVTKNTEYYLTKGKDAIAAHDPDEAVKNLSRATTRYPDCVEAYTLMAQANTDRDSFDLAVENYTEVIRLNPKPNNLDYIGSLYFLRARVYYKNTKDSLACNDWDKACNDFGYLAACKQLRMLCK